jgi:hypothetical protein
MTTKIFKAIILGLLPFFLIACGGGVTGDAKNYIVVEDQTLIDLNKVEISEVKLEEPAWIVIYESTGPQQVQGDANHVVGKKSLSAGEYDSIEVPLERNIVNGELLYAELRKDAGVIEKFEPETQDTVISQTSINSVSFLVYLSDEPYINIGSGEIHKSKIIVSKVITNRSSWMVAYAFDENAVNNLGSILSIRKLEPGHHQDVELAFNLEGKSAASLSDGDRVLIALHENTVDTSTDDSFDIENDPLVLSQGQAVIGAVDVVFVADSSDA